LPLQNVDRLNARDPSATARRERAYKFGQAQQEKLNALENLTSDNTSTS